MFQSSDDDDALFLSLTHKHKLQPAVVELPVCYPWPWPLAAFRGWWCGQRLVDAAGLGSRQGALCRGDSELAALLVRGSRSRFGASNESGGREGYRGGREGYRNCS
jgi:hypothetical protein